MRGRPAPLEQCSDPTRFWHEVNETEHPGDWSELGARILEVAAAATAIHLNEQRQTADSEVGRYETTAQAPPPGGCDFARGS